MSSLRKNKKQFSNGDSYQFCYVPDERHAMTFGEKPYARGAKWECSANRSWDIKGKMEFKDMDSFYVQSDLYEIDCPSTI